MKRYTRLAPSGTVDTETEASSRIVRYMFSDESVGRDGHIVKTSAWRTDNFNANPVFLWSHLDQEPPIGRVFGLSKQNRQLLGAVKYAETDFADTIYQLVRNKMLQAVSTSWQPISYDRMPDGSGLIFTDVDLLEISQCSIPALPTALATARSRINIRPLYEWASRALDTGRMGNLDRPQLEAICRAAKPTYISLGDDMSTREEREQRMARARALQRGSTAEFSAEERTFYEKYVVARDAYGLNLEQFLTTIPMAPDIARARAIIARGMSAYTVTDRPIQRSADVVTLPVTRKFSQADRSKLRGTERHLAKAVAHHSTLDGHHDTLAEHLGTARAAHRRIAQVTSTLKDLGYGRSARTTSTLAELGYDHGQVTRALTELGDALDSITKVHGDAEDAAGSAEDCVRSARASLNGMLGSGSDE